MDKFEQLDNKIQKLKQSTKKKKTNNYSALHSVLILSTLGLNFVFVLVAFLYLAYLLSIYTNLDKSILYLIFIFLGLGVGVYSDYIILKNTLFKNKQ